MTDTTATDPSAYVPPKVWTWDKESGGKFASINRPIAGPTHDLAAGIAEAGDVIFLAVDDPFVADQLRRGRDVLGVRRRHIGFGHAGRTDTDRIDQGRR